VADPRPGTVPTPPGDDEAFTPQVAERIIRRAVCPPERTADARSLEDVKQTLSALGVAPETAERAAAEVRGELKGVWRIRSPGEVFLHIALFLLSVWPGLALVLFSQDVPLLPPWLALLLGLWLLFAALRWQVREVARAWRTRHLKDAVPE
jgi:hypothetical protein